MNPTSKKRAVQGDKELLRKLLNAKTRSKLLIDNRFRKWAVNYGETQDKCESEKIDRYLIIAKKPKRRKLRYDNKNYVKSLVNKPLDYHKLGSETLPEWTVPPDNRNFMKSCINERLGLHRKVPQRERKWEVPHNNVNYISKYVNKHLGEHQHTPEEAKQWIVNPDNKNFVTSFVNEQHGMHRTIPQKKPQWNVTNDNKNYSSYFVNKHKGMHRHDGAPEPEWDVYHNNQSYVKSLVNEHVGMHREVPETVEKWHVIQGNNQNYLKSYVNEHHGWHRLIDEETDRWQVGPDNRNFIKRYVNDHVGFHRQVPETERLWEIPPNNKNYIMSSVNDHKGVHQDAPSLERQWNVDSDNKNFIKSRVNENIGMHALKEEDLQKWKVHYNNSNYMKSSVNEYQGKHRDDTVQAKHWPIEYDNSNFMKATVNSHLGNHRDVASQEWQWKVLYGNRNYIRSCINDHQNLHMDMPDIKRDWEIKDDNKNFIKSYINEDAGEHWRAQDPEKKWNITSDNKNYIKSYVNKHRGMHRIPSDLLIESEEDEGSMSDTNSVKIAEGNPKLTEIKYKKNVKIVKADMDDLELEGGAKEDFDAAPDAASGCAFKQEDVPHVPLMRKVSTGGFRFYGVVRNIYDYDIDEKDLSASLKVNPESYRRSKSRDYRKPGTIQSGFDTEDFAKKSLTVPEAKDTARIKFEKQIVTAEQTVEPQKPILSKHTEDTLSYFRENASKNAPSKWQKVGPQPQRPSASNFRDRAEQFKRNTALESSRPGVADTLLYFNQKVTPVHEKKTTNVADTLSHFHHKVAPDRPTMEVAPRIRKPEISSRVQDTLSQYQKEAIPKKKPTMPMSIQPQHREELQETTITTDNVSKRIKPNTVGQNDDNFVTFMAEMDEHLSHPNDHGIKHHRRYEEFSNDHGSEIYMKTDEKYMEINHPGGTT